MDEQIKIHVHTNSTRNHQIIYVNKSDLIGCIFKNDDSTMVIFDGKILSFGFSFGFFGITNGSHLYVLTNEQKLSDNSIFYRKKIRKIKHELEELRLLDTFMNKIEFSPKCYRKVISRFKEAYNSEKMEIKCDSICDLSVAPDSPSTEALPSLWD